MFGTPKGAKEPHAARFDAPYAQAAQVAAQRHGLAAIPVETAETRVTAATLRQGQLQPGGRLVLFTVSDSHATRLRALAAAVATPAASPTTPATAGVQVPPETWDRLKPADIVLAANLDPSGEPDGWYEALVMKVENGVYVLRWLYEPELGFIRLPRQHIALMFPG